MKNYTLEAEVVLYYYEEVFYKNEIIIREKTLPKTLYFDVHLSDIEMELRKLRFDSIKSELNFKLRCLISKYLKNDNVIFDYTIKNTTYSEVEV